MQSYLTKFLYGVFREIEADCTIVALDPVWKFPSPDLRGLESASWAKKLLHQGRLDGKNRLIKDLEGLKSEFSNKLLDP